MATKHHTSIPIRALAAILLALAIGSMPLVVLVTLGSKLEAIK